MITICTKQLGRRRPLLDDWSFTPPREWPDGEEPLTLRRLITRIVRQEVAAFRARQQKQTTFQVMTAAAISRGAERGEVKPGGELEPQDVNDDEAVGAALQAFEDGLYLVFIDEVEQQDLEQEVFLHDDSTITFVRLVMLAGA